MPSEIIKSDELVSFEKFKKDILERGIDSDFFGAMEKKYAKIPDWVKTLQNLDPTGVSGMLEQLASEKISEREQDNILWAIYDIFQKVNLIEAEQEIPTSEKIVYETGILLDQFESKMREVSNLSVQNRMRESFVQAGKLLFGILDNSLPPIKALLKNSSEVESELIYLNQLFSIYGATLDRYIWQENAPLDSVYMNTGGLEDKNEKELSLRTGKVFFDVLEQVKKVRQALKEGRGVSRKLCKWDLDFHSSFKPDGELVQYQRPVMKGRTPFLRDIHIRQIEQLS